MKKKCETCVFAINIEHEYNTCTCDLNAISFKRDLEDVCDDYSSDCVCVVSEHVELKKRKDKFVGLCPFHDEKTPTLTVDPESNEISCFGCGFSGDSVVFHEALQNKLKKIG